MNSLSAIGELCVNVNSLISSLQCNTILFSSVSCFACQHPCKFKKMSFAEAKHFSDGVLWRCSNVQCRKRISVTGWSFFDGGKTSLSELTKLLFSHYKNARIKNARDENDADPHTCATCYRIFKQLLAKSMGQTAICGPDLDLEIDETLVLRRKNQQGKIIKSAWLFSSVCCQTKEVFAVTVPNRTAETLLLLARRYILLGTTICSDYWQHYFGIRTLRNKEGRVMYSHQTINHKENFVDLNFPYVHIQAIVVTWRVLKTYLNVRGRRRANIGRYLQD